VEKKDILNLSMPNFGKYGTRTTKIFSGEFFCHAQHAPHA
jgi:hypothetical protein